MTEGSKHGEERTAGMQVTPLKQEERLITLDSLRGLALLGIFLVNMISFHSPYIYYNPFEWWEGASDRWHFSWIDLFIQASFYPLFAMMFGFGAAMQAEHAARRGQSYTGIGIRRFSFLMILGLVHAFLIWSGDILFSYALFGFLLLLFMRLSGRMLVVLGSLLLFIPGVFLGVLLVLMSLVDPLSTSHWTDIGGVERSMAAYGSGTFGEVTAQRIVDWLTINGLGVIWTQLISIFPLFLIGAGAQKLQVFSRWQKRPSLAWFVFASFFTAGIILKALPYVIEANLAYTFVQDSVGGPLLAIGYAALIIAIGSSAHGQTFLKPFASAGRMSLTNYLLQSIIGTLIFYPYGLGLYGQIELSTGVWLVLAIFAAQVIASELWLSKFERGPMEQLWRWSTYGLWKKGRKESE
ncbi:DUF418 domain-containing protein [Bacillus thermotolerans]|uniref:DUF418 domain-containing protein n=1 Tax=Bacillus thermotolerans TaxID=1221996 RepID=A0A0F5I562_BACTR|nr:DUF418 domain-containing protein [Bacillus thermotolerans]KKB36784.1 hypothetical protein QY97_00746 [Bacillus thermotolerans]KKB40410.1 hypothetical protein QY95_01405 [Bacillus thermotolerans]